MALWAATSRDSYNIVSLLLKYGADPHAFHDQYGTALQAAAYNNQLDIVRVLAQAGVDINQRGGEHGSALVAAAPRATRTWFGN